MNYFRILCLVLLFFFATNYSVFSQSNLVQDITLTASQNSFTYPQSVFVDSPNGNIWVTDFDNNRVLRFDVSTLTGIKENQITSLPTMFTLEQNYPNPFNPMTVIKFSTKFTGYVKLKVYNILGKEIMTLYEGITLANTTQTINFDAKMLTSGIYFYSLFTERGSLTKRMCLLK